MTDTAKRLAGPLQVATAAATVYTVPALTTAIVRGIHAINTSGAVRAFTLSIGADAAGTRLYHAISIPVAGSLDWQGFAVLAAGEILQAFSDVAGVTLTVSGVEVS